MNLYASLVSAHSKTNTIQIVNWIDANQKRFEQLLEIFINGEYLIVQRAAWPFSYCVIAHPELLKKNCRKLLSKLEDPHQPVAVKRNILRIFDRVPQIPKSCHGILMHACFNYIQNPKETIAVQAFALGILYKFSRFYPKIVPEIKAIVAERLPNASAAFRSRAKKYFG